MARLTMELRDCLELLNDDGTPFQLFDFEYQCDDVAWKAELEKEITDYYFLSEMGQETVERFKHTFRSRMQRIMPFYNKLRATTLLDYDPLKGNKLTETLQKTKNNTGTQGNTATHTGTQGMDSRNTEYPQHTVITEDIPTGRTQNTRTDNLSQEVTLTNNLTETDTYTKTIEGLTGMSYPDLVKKHRQNLIRINGMIIQELKPCFLLVY